jgi:hypothetical protein
LAAWSATAFAATAALGTLTQFLIGDLAVAVFVSALHAFPRLGRHFILGDEAVAILVERLEVWTLATFTTFATGTLSRTAGTTWAVRTLGRWWGLVAARWGLNCYRSSGERKCEECGCDTCECLCVHISTFLSVTGICLECVGGDKDSSAGMAFVTASNHV